MDREQVDFCSLCGTDIQADPEHPHVHLMCPRCAASGTKALKALEGTPSSSPATLSGSWDGDRVKIVTYVNDLGPSRRPGHISRWPYKVFETLCDEKRVNFPATCWTFHARFLPALEEIIHALDKSLVLFDRD